MAALFPRTLRSVEKEGLAWWLVVGGGGLAVLGLLGAWLFTAEVPIRQFASRAVIVEHSAAASSAEAVFHPSALAQLRAGQRAWVKVESPPSFRYGAVPATVERLALSENGSELRARIRLSPHEVDVPMHVGMRASVEVVVGRTRPLQLLLGSDHGVAASDTQ